MQKILLLTLLLSYHLPAFSATCPKGSINSGGTYSEEFYSCYEGKIYPKNLKYCAPENEGNKKWRGDEGFYNPLDYKCVEDKVIGKNQDLCSKGKLGPGGVYGNIDFYCNEGGIYYKLNNHKIN